MFDLPISTSSEQKRYRHFRQKLLQHGFIMEQYSVYVKLALNQSAVDNTYKVIELIAPENGHIQMMTVTEKQYSAMRHIVGAKRTNIINDTERITII